MAYLVKEEAKWVVYVKRDSYDVPVLFTECKECAELLLEAFK